MHIKKISLNKWQILAILGPRVSELLFYFRPGLSKGNRNVVDFPFNFRLAWI